MRASTVQMSLQYLRDLGYDVDVCERWVPSPHGQVRKDLFGILDLVAIRGTETLGVQTTTRGEAPKRLRKILASEYLPSLRAAGWQIVVHGWHQPRGPRTRWVCEESFVDPRPDIDNPTGDRHQRSPQQGQSVRLVSEGRGST